MAEPQNELLLISVVSLEAHNQNYNSVDQGEQGTTPPPPHNHPPLHMMPEYTEHPYHGQGRRYCAHWRGDIEGRQVGPTSGSTSFIMACGTQ